MKLNISSIQYILEESLFSTEMVGTLLSPYYYKGYRKTLWS